MRGYTARLKAILSPKETRLFERLNSPQKIQNYLDTLPINFERKGETYRSPRQMLGAKEAHCFEGALFAAAALAYHGERPLILDFQTIPEDIEHVVTPFQQNGFWGAISKTNHAILRYRDPVYKTPRELAMSFFHEYMLHSGEKSMRSYSKFFDLSKYAPQKWVTAEEDLFWLVDAVDESSHFPVAPTKNLKLLRKGSKLEREAFEATEWSEKKKKRL